MNGNNSKNHSRTLTYYLNIYNIRNLLSASCRQNSRRSASLFNPVSQDTPMLVSPVFGTLSSVGTAGVATEGIRLPASCDTPCRSSQPLYLEARVVVWTTGVCGEFDIFS
jgi:hypothetical protein